MSVCGASYLRRWRLLPTALLILAAVQPTSGDCPKSCACSVPAEMHCTFRYLTAVPDHIPPAVERINLGYNSITVLREFDLAGLENLELLMLHSNTIHNIEDRAFQDLKSLKILKMSFNKVKEVNKDTLRGLDSLQRLHMDHNQIEFINPEAFYGLTGLQLVHLEGNQLHQLHPDTFVTLRHSEVFKVSSVRNIHLSDNLLTSLPEDIFVGCSQLENVFLHGNPWTCDCHMSWFPLWAQRNAGVLKCKRDRRHPVQLCPVCESPSIYHNRPLSLLPSGAFTCTKPWIQPHLKLRNISVDEGDFTPVSPKDFIAPLGSIQMNLTDHYRTDASLACTVQRPSNFENLTLNVEEEAGNNITVLSAGITTYLVCNVDYEHIQQLWQILATYSDTPMRLERGFMLARSPEMVYRYSQMKVMEGEEGIHTNIEAEIKAIPAWLLQGEVHFQLDRTTTTYSTLHIKYQSTVNLRVENMPSSKRGRYSWTMIEKDNKTKTEHAVLIGGVAQLNCQIRGEPKPLLEWILPDGTKVRAPYTSEDRRIIITTEGKLTLRGADASDTGLYRCITTNYLDADILAFRVTVLSPDVEEADVNGVQLSRRLGENLVFDCGTSSPEASVQWILPDHSVLDTSSGNRKIYENGTLKVEGLTRRDRGFYRCLAANHLGVDLLVSQVKLSEEEPESVTDVDEEGSGTEVEVATALTEKTTTIDEILPASPSDRNSQESRTITSDRPFPRLRSRGKGSHMGRLGQRRRGPLSNRRVWSSRVFDKAPRKIDPKKFAEFVKKAQDGSRVKTGADKTIKDESQIAFSGDSEMGSGGDHNEDHLIIIPTTFKPTTDNPQQMWQESREFEVIPQMENRHDGIMETIGTHEPVGMESQITEDANMLTTESYMQSDSTPIMSLFTHSPKEDTVTPYTVMSTHTNIEKTTDFYPLEKTTKPSLSRQPVSLQLTMTDSSQETLVQYSGEEPAEPETSTGAALSFTTDPNVTPMKDGPGPVELVIHTDPESQTTFTAVTTTEQEKDQITFHTTQTIKSPHLPPGSTIISQQQIHIIPHKNGRGGGRRRTFQGRRRIIKPNRITDIQSFINKLKQTSAKKEGNTTVPYRVELSTVCDCDGDKKKTESTDVQMITPTISSSSLHRTEKPNPPQTTAAAPTNNFKTPFTQTLPRPEASNDYITSADAPVVDPTTDSPLTTNKITTPPAKTTTSSKVIRGKIPWNRIFGGRHRERTIGRLRKPLITTKTTTTAATTTLATTTAPATMPITTERSLAEPMTLPSSRHTESKESSLDDDYGDSSSADLELTTQSPTVQHLTTTSSVHFRDSTTPETPPDSQTLASPPTVKPPSTEKLDEAFSSGSGGLPDESLIIRQRPGLTRGRPGRRRRPFRGRRPLRKFHPTRTTEASTETTPTETTMKTTTETTVFTQQTVSKRIQTPSVTADKTTVAASTDQTSAQTDSYENIDWGKFTSSSSPNYTPSKTPLITSTLFTPTSSKATYTTAPSRVYNTIRPMVNRNNGPSIRRPPIRRIRPTVQSKGSKDSADKTLTFDTRTITTTTSAPNNAIPDVYGRVTSNDATSAKFGFETTTNAMTNKPKIVGGNAASFTVLSNSDAFLPCEATGSPQPTVSWKRFSTSTGSTITIKGRMGKFEVLRNGTLSIQNASIKDRGQYLCLAENVHGSDKLIVTLSVVAYPSRILEPKIRDMKSHAGDTVEMKCQTDGRPTPMISWILANRTQIRGPNTPHGRVSVTAGGTLVIRQVSVFDRGHYKCIASNSAGADTATVRLQVVAAPPGILEEKRQQMKVVVRQNLWLPCTGHGSPQPTIHWVLNDGSVVRYSNSAKHSRISVHENGTLHITNVATADSGKYECIATSSTGSERRVVTLTVEKRESEPQIVEISQRITELFFGDDLKLNCLATGDPKPRVIWRLPSKAVVEQSHRMGSRIQVLDNGTLIINSVIDKDAGDYLCVARNSIGDDLQLMRVRVSMKPAKIEHKLYGKKQVPYGNDLKVDCKASGAPKPDISWGLPDGTVVNKALQADASFGGGRTRRYTLFDNGTLYLNQVGMSEEGDYTCIAENQVGKDEMHVHITVVTAAPRIQSHSQTYARVKPGGNIRFDCEAVGEPKPKILWMLPTNDIIAASNERYLMHVNGSLDIRNVRLVDAGEYVCMARNPAGENRKVYKLDIDGNPPVINGYRQNRTVIKEVAAKFSRKFIDCKVEGEPTPTVTWIMPDNIFLRAPYFGSRINVHRNGTLEIRNVRPTDRAEFICMARNDGGEAVMVVQLEVTSTLRRPIFKNPFNERIMARTGKTTVLNCSVEGYPEPEITWVLPNGSRLTGHEDNSHHHLGKDGILIIYNPQVEDAGKYRCGAKNLVGYIEKLIIMDVGQKPYILTRPRGVIRSVSGDQLFLHCLSDGNPRPRIYWTIPGGHTLTRPQVLGRYQLLNNGTLIVRDTTLHDRGNYICRARNDAGEAMLTIPVAIIAFPPRITKGPPSTMTAEAGSPVQLNCAAIGVPKPEITWELPDHTFLSAAEKGRQTGSELLHPPGTLVIQRLTASDTGSYKCMAKNQLGTDTKIIYVHVM